MIGGMKLSRIYVCLSWSIGERMTIENKQKNRNKSKLLEKIPSQKFGLPEDVAAAAVFLASDEASYINGSTIHLNGGLAMI